MSGDVSVYASPSGAVLRILFAQLGIAFGVAGVSWLVSGTTAAYSVLLGGAACVLPNAFLGARILAFGAGTARTMMRSAYLGELGKIILTVLAFGMIFAFVRPLHAGLVFAGFIACQGVMLAALIATNKTETKRILTRAEHGSRETFGR